MINKRRFGIIGEKIAKDYLSQKGYHIITTNFYTRNGEIDIIAKKENYIDFREVKTRTSNIYGTPASAVNKTKIKHMSDAARVFLRLNKFNKYEIRFDVIEIFIKDGKCKINHIKQII